MKWTETKKDEHYTSGKYEIKVGKNANIKTNSVPATMNDVYHCYHDGKYIAQTKSIDAAKKECESHEVESA